MKISQTEVLRGSRGDEKLKNNKKKEKEKNSNMIMKNFVIEILN